MTALSATPARPILFSGAMVKEIIAGTKTQTRRVMKPHDASHRMLCPYGWMGDLCWVRETWARDEECGGFLYRADHAGDDPIGDGWKLSIHMPRCASRLTLQLSDVRIQRLKDITEADAKAEGADTMVMDDDCKFYQVDAGGSYRCGFAGLWNHINGKRPGTDWDANPYVWAISFKHHCCNVDEMGKTEIAA